MPSTLRAETGDMPEGAPRDSAPDPRAAPEGAVSPLLADMKASPVSERRLVSRTGASATLHEDDASSRIEVRDASARLVFELDLASGRAVLHAPGDLKLAAGGDVEIAAAGAVRCRGREVEISTGDGPGAARLELGASAVRLTSRLLRMVAGKADLALGDVGYEGERLAAKLGEATVVASRLETAADRVFERARNVFRSVEDLHQLTAGRVRDVVRGGWQIRAGHAALDAEQDVKIDGKSIHLG